ncbi:MAG: winged helix-turn-helix domain-containing protein [Candidatus Hodarchaeota archaeon]
MNNKIKYPKNPSLPEKIHSFNIKDIPLIKYVGIPKQTYESHPIRAAIMRILLEGITEGRPNNRYALNVKEIKNLLKERKKIDISITNLYFHINKLLNAEFITVVETFKEKRHKIAYYGRSARIVIFYDPEYQVQKHQEKFSEFIKFVKLLNPNVSVAELENLSEQYFELTEKRAEKLVYWLAEYVELIDKENLDIIKIHDVLKLIDTINPEYSSIITKLKEILPVTINSSV